MRASMACQAATRSPIRLPSCSLEPNLVERIWPHLRKCLLPHRLLAGLDAIVDGRCNACSQREDVSFSNQPRHLQEVGPP